MIKNILDPQSKTVSFFVSPSEYKTMSELAAYRGMNLATFLRYRGLMTHETKKVPDFGEKRTSLQVFRVSEDEKRRILTNAKECGFGRNLSNFIRMAALYDDKDKQD